MFLFMCEQPVIIAIFLAFLLEITVYISEQLDLGNDMKEIGGLQGREAVIEVAHYLIHGREKELVQLEETRFG